MECNLVGLIYSKEWRNGKNLSGYLTLDDGTELTDYQVRKVVRLALSAGLTNTCLLDDTEVKKWLNLK